ncbi:3-oxoacyl-[acyl-carrier-protein] reductase [Helicovermis profundi]|uniref:3-oxoacyl-[acyl-carrier-protein] reductase n=1 Tax=Helicovermis profundi TaxID=3065157 RepID=A0AAU9E484_9FIRM|nr:3-oxoacyl-[acyl-carrier-protein] reductase [Clostridia bacterium S502]
MNFSGKNVVITGGSRGIGKAIALEFAKKGANVIINYNSSAELALKVVEEVKSYNVNAKAYKCNVASSDDVKTFTKDIYKDFDKIDILVNNAGITKDGLLIRMKDEDWDNVLNVNLKGSFLCTREIGKKMLKQKSGRIINISSVVGLMGNAGQANYSASKAGLIGLTKSSAKEFSSRGINVNAVAPGFIQSDMTAKLSDEVIGEYKKHIPLGNLGVAKDVANAVMFLSSEYSSYITGQVINVDGGMLI